MRPASLMILPQLLFLLRSHIKYLGRPCNYDALFYSIAMLAFRNNYLIKIPEDIGNLSIPHSELMDPDSPIQRASNLNLHVLIPKMLKGKDDILSDPMFSDKNNETGLSELFDDETVKKIILDWNEMKELCDER
jgi:hypothetical protein